MKGFKLILLLFMVGLSTAAYGLAEGYPNNETYLMKKEADPEGS